MVPIALNYNSLAVVHARGSCAFAVGGCTDSTALRYDSSATVDDGSCVPRISGCMLPSALNYDSAATVTAPGDCVVAVEGCTDSTARNSGRLRPSTAAAARPTRRGAQRASLRTTTRPRATTTARVSSPSLAAPIPPPPIIAPTRPRRRRASTSCPAAPTRRPPTSTPPPRPTTARARTFASGARHGGGELRPARHDADAALCSYEGCTDSRATNYEAIATVDDGRRALRASVQVATFGTCSAASRSSMATTTACDAGVEPSSRSDVATGFASVAVRRRRRGAARRRPIDDRRPVHRPGDWLTLPLPLFTDVAADIATPYLGRPFPSRRARRIAIRRLRDPPHRVILPDRRCGATMPFSASSRARRGSARRRGAGSRRRCRYSRLWRARPPSRRSCRPPAEATSAASRARSTRRSPASSTPPPTTSPAASP